MRPVKQTILHDPANGQYGDCFRACIASLLELPINEVPHVCDGKPEGDTTWYAELSAWLAPRGLVYLEFGTGDGWAASFAAAGGETFHVISGRSPRGHLHAIVGRNGEPFFDPHPSGAGLTTVESFGILTRRCAGFTLPLTASERELLRQLDAAIGAMSALQRSVIEMGYDPDEVIVSGAQWREFVDAHARALFERGPVAVKEVRTDGARSR